MSNPSPGHSSSGQFALFVEGAVDDILQGYADSAALRHRLRHEDDEHVFLRVEPERGAAGTLPVHFADGAFRKTHAGVGTNGEAQSESEAGSG